MDKSATYTKWLNEANQESKSYSKVIDTAKQENKAYSNWLTKFAAKNSSKD